jgi:hypothetical protein
MDTESLSERSVGAADHYAASPDSGPAQSLLVQLALFFSRFDPLSALNSNFEEER